MDNLDSYIEGVEAVEQIFVLPNTTSKLQRMDQRVIRALKAKYRSVIVKFYITYIEAKRESTKDQHFRSNEVSCEGVGQSKQGNHPQLFPV